MERIQSYFPNLSAQQLSQLEQLQDVYLDWNSKINVISRKDAQHLYLKHVLHSLSIAKVVEFAPGSSILDIGTGGGFPGIPLAIYFPQVRFHLIDSIAKKIRVVHAVVDELQLSNVTAAQENAKFVKKKFDFTVSRAVAPLNDLVQWSQPLLTKKSSSKFRNGLICLKGGNLDAELKEVRQPAIRYPISAMFSEEFFQEKYVLYVRLREQ